MKLFEHRLNGMWSSDPASDSQHLIQAIEDLFTTATRMKFQLPLYKLFKTPTQKKFEKEEGFIHQYVDTAQIVYTPLLTQISNSL